MRAVTAALAVALAAVGTGLGASTASGAPAELIGPPRQVYSDGGETYLVDAARGTVQWLDRTTMAPRGALVELGGPIGRPVVDPAGILWATVGDSGYVTGVFRDRRARPIRVSGEGQTLQLVLVTGRLVAFDRTDWAIYLVAPDGVSGFRIQPEIRDSLAPTMHLPARTESSLLPMLGRGRLIVVDIDQKWSWFQKHNLAEKDLIEPQAFGRSIVLTWHAWTQRINFLGRAEVEPGRALAGTAGYRTVVVANGGLFVDEEHNAKPR